MIDIERKGHGDLLGARVFGHIREAFLKDAIGRGGDLGARGWQVPRCVQGRFQVGALAGSAHEPFGGTGKPEVVEDSRTQLGDDGAGREEGARHHGVDVGDIGGDRLRVVAVPPAQELEGISQGGQLLPELVVKLTRERLALTFARGLEVGRQPPHLVGALGHTTLEVVFEEAQLRGLSVAGSQEHEGAEAEAVGGNAGDGGKDGREELEAQRQADQGILPMFGIEAEKSRRPAQGVERRQQEAARRRQGEADGRQDDQVAEVEPGRGRAGDASELPARDKTDDGARHPHDEDAMRSQTWVRDAEKRGGGREEDRDSADQEDVAKVGRLGHDHEVERPPQDDAYRDEGQKEAPVAISLFADRGPEGRDIFGARWRQRLDQGREAPPQAVEE